MLIFSKNVIFWNLLKFLENFEVLSKIFFLDLLKILNFLTYFFGNFQLFRKIWCCLKNFNVFWDILKKKKKLKPQIHFYLFLTGSNRYELEWKFFKKKIKIFKKKIKTFSKTIQNFQKNLVIQKFKVFKKNQIIHTKNFSKKVKFSKPLKISGKINFFQRPSKFSRNFNMF